MNANSNPRINEWAKFDYHDPRDDLIKFRELEKKVAGSNLDERTRRLRTNRLKRARECRDAALVCHGIGTAILHTTLYYALVEASDYDCVTMWVDGDTQHFAPLQIKELPPSQFNPPLTINDIISGLEKYPVSSDTIVAIHVGRQLNFSEIKIPKLNIGELWIFGSQTPDQSKWFLCGNVLAQPRFCDFDYPSNS